MLIGAVALVALGAVLFQQLSGDDDNGDPSNPPTTAPDAAELAASSPASAASATAGSAGGTPIGMPQTSACWNGEPTTTGGSPVQWDEVPQQVIDPARTYSATIETTAGTIVVDLDQERAPVTVNNFVCLAQAGFYDNTSFHRIIRDFMIQGGDPTGTGTGGPGYRFQDELPQGETPYLRGTIAMANSGPDTNGSQFFIVHQDQPGAFPKNYSIFGQVSQGMDVVDALAAMPVADNGMGEISAPTGDVRIVSVTISEQ